jgi:Patatin-like phospholipase
MGKCLLLHDVLREEYETIHEETPESGDLRELFTKLHEKRQTALCFSGGGIRSATFCLGVIQGLAQRGLLPKFHYLSTVSGGGYIGAWLSAYARRSGGIDKVAAELNEPPKDPLDPEVGTIKYLRQFSNYLSPKLGLLSADTWTLVGTYLRNVMLTWLVLVPLFVAVLAVPRLLLSALQWHPPICFVYLASGVAIAGYFAALWHLCGARPVGCLPRFWSKRGEDAKPYLRNGAFVLRAVLPLVLCAVAVALAHGWHPHRHSRQVGLIAAGIAVAMSALLSHVYMTRFKSAAYEGEEIGNRRRGVNRFWFLAKKWFAEFLSAAVSGVVGVTIAFFALGSETFSPPFDELTQPVKLDWMSIATVFPSARIALYVCFAVPLLLGALAIQATIFIAGASWFNEEYDREWWARAGAWCAIAAIAWIAVTFLALYGPVLIYYAPRTITGIGMITGGFAVLMGRSAKTAANRKQKEEEGLLGKSINISLGLAVPIFVICLLAALSLGTTKILEGVIGGPAPMSVRDRNLLERTSWTYEVKEAAKMPPLEPGQRTKKTIEMPAMEGDTFAARQHFYVAGHTTPPQALAVIGIGLAVSALASFFVGVNRFSMNALYRNRLIRAYLGSSRRKRAPNPFTGFDPEDNMQMHELLPEYITPDDLIDAPALVRALKKPQDEWLKAFAAIVPQFGDIDESSTLLGERLARRLRSVVFERDLTTSDFPNLADAARTPLQRIRNRRVLEQNFPGCLRPMPKAPFHVVNMALNLVSGDALAWSERMAQSFTASPLHCGSHSAINPIGYRNTVEYAGPSGLSLGMAVSVSGAAASPNMGYHSSPALAFLLTFFNVRLGAWLGNPKNDETFEQPNPRWSLYPLVSEAVGATDASHPYVYLSDGGHFENLGLYEMVRRRCRWIVVCDAGEDPSFHFEDLGNAIRKIRIDFGIPITIERMGLYPRPKTADGKLPDNPKYCAWGTIDYAAVDGGNAKGEFIYLKPAFYGEREPKDVFNYAMTNPAFPHETTLGDQFFSESQFESYRILGQHTVKEIWGDEPIPSVQAFVKTAELYVNRTVSAPKVEDRN